jgi:hypothetical protein
MMLLNWAIETYKWQFMIGKIEKINFFKAFQGVLAGLTVSLFTPNRIGEYGGRIFVLEKADRLKAIIITLIGSMSQLMITIITGSLSLIYFTYKYLQKSIYFNNYFYYGFIFITIILLSFLLILYFNISILSPLINKISILKKIKKYGVVFKYYKNKDLIKIFLLSTFRYLVFSIQYYIILRIFNINLSIFDGLIMISLIFFIISVIPTIALVEIGIRGSVALYFISFLLTKPISTESQLEIINSSIAIWIINLVIPAIFGTLFIPKLKFFRKKI